MLKLVRWSLAFCGFCGGFFLASHLCAISLTQYNYPPRKIELIRLQGTVMSVDDVHGTLRLSGRNPYLPGFYAPFEIQKPDQVPTIAIEPGKNVTAFIIRRGGPLTAWELNSGAL